MLLANNKKSFHHNYWKELNLVLLICVVVINNATGIVIRDKQKIGFIMLQYFAVMSAMC